MHWLNSKSLKTKLLLVPMIGVVGFVIIMVGNYSAGTLTDKTLHQVRDRYYPVLSNANNAIVEIERIGEVLNSAVSAGDIDILKSADKIADNVRRLFDEIVELESGSDTEVTENAALFERYYEKARQLTESIVSGDADFSNLNEQIAELNQLQSNLSTKLNELRDDRYQRFTDSISESIEVTEDSLIMGLSVAVLVAGLLISVGIYIPTVITRNVNKISASLKDIAQGDGDLTRRIPQESKDEIGELVYWFNSFIEKLQVIIRDVVVSSDPLTDISKELASLAHTSKTATESQLTSASNVMRSMNEMFSSLSENAANTASAADAAGYTDEQAQSGQAIVKVAIQTIDDLVKEVTKAGDSINQLEKDTANVASILDVIQTIASQTNLLALNAAIEAARAGEHGRGFAVVADEVRTLASKTQESTEEIHNVIEQLQKTARSVCQIMEAGQSKASISIAKANEAGSSLEAITQRVAEISTMNTQIAAATEEQQQTSHFIQNAINEIRESAEKAAEGSAKVAGSTDQLMNVTTRLKSVASQFKV